MGSLSSLSIQERSFFFRLVICISLKPDLGLDSFSLPEKTKSVVFVKGFGRRKREGSTQRKTYKERTTSRNTFSVFFHEERDEKKSRHLKCPHEVKGEENRTH